jgi:hypothetical protein
MAAVDRNRPLRAQVWLSATNLRLLGWSQLLLVHVDLMQVCATECRLIRNYLGDLILGKRGYLKKTSQSKFV